MATKKNLEKRYYATTEGWTRSMLLSYLADLIKMNEEMVAEDGANPLPKVNIKKLTVADIKKWANDYASIEPGDEEDHAEDADQLAEDLIMVLAKRQKRKV